MDFRLLYLARGFPTPANLPFDSSGNLVVSRSLPKNAGFGVANAYQAPRTLQAQIRFSF